MCDLKLSWWPFFGHVSFSHEVLLFACRHELLRPHSGNLAEPSLDYPHPSDDDLKSQIKSISTRVQCRQAYFATAHEFYL